MKSTHREPSPADALRLAVVGVGQRAEILRHAIAAGEQVVAAVDPSEEGRAYALELFGPEVALLESHEQLTTVNGLDAAFVLTPDGTHARIAIDLLEAGIPVYLEKPLAISVVDADETLAAAKSTGTPLYVGHNFRHSPVVVLMRELIERGEIGEVKAVWCRHFVGNGADYYFKDWHADRSKTNSLLLQKASHDIDVIHYLSGGYGRRVVGMGGLVVYGSIADRADRTGQRMTDWFSMDNWPPLSNTGLNPVVDVEDISMLMMELDNGVQASYQQCHFTPDYWRNYTVIGTEGRLENFGNGEPGTHLRLWNQRASWNEKADATYRIPIQRGTHGGADPKIIGEFLRFVREGGHTDTSPLAARESIAAGCAATDSLRHGGIPQKVPAPSPAIVKWFKNGGA